MRFCRLKETQFYVYTRETDQTPITVLAIQVSHNDWWMTVICVFMYYCKLNETLVLYIYNMCILFTVHEPLLFNLYYSIFQFTVHISLSLPPSCSIVQWRGLQYLKRVRGSHSMCLSKVVRRMCLLHSVTMMQQHGSASYRYVTDMYTTCSLTCTLQLHFIMLEFFVIMSPKKL